MSEVTARGPYELPEGWKWAKLGDVLARKPQYGLTARSSKERKEIRYIRISDITDYGQLKHDDPRFLDLNDDEFKKYELVKNDILIARSGTVGRIYLHENSDQKSIFASYLIRFKLNPEIILPKFLFYYGLSPVYKNWIDLTLRRVAQPNINARKYSQLKIPLPPLEEQRRIVTRIEEFVNKIEEARRLKRISKERSKKVMQAAHHKVFSKAKEKEWELKKIEDIVSSLQSGFACSKEHKVEKGVPHLRPNNIGFNGNLDLSELVHLPKGLVNLNKYSLRRGDVLFNNTNSKELVGRVALVYEDLDYGFSNHITRIRTSSQLVPNWLVASLNHLWYQGYFLKICRKWVGQAGVNNKMLKSIEIPFPPIKEQRRIIGWIEKLKREVESLKSLQRKVNDGIKNLTPSILDKAFKGKLN